MSDIVTRDVLCLILDLLVYQSILPVFIFSSRLQGGEATTLLDGLVGPKALWGGTCLLPVFIFSSRLQGGEATTLLDGLVGPIDLKTLLVKGRPLSCLVLDLTITSKVEIMVKFMGKGSFYTQKFGKGLGLWFWV